MSGRAAGRERPLQVALRPPDHTPNPYARPGIAVAILIGWLFLISRVVGLATTFMARNAPGFWWSLQSAVLGIAAGVVLLGCPVLGGISLTLLLTVFLTIAHASGCQGRVTCV